MEATIGFPENLKFQGLINVKKVYFYTALLQPNLHWKSKFLSVMVFY